jgi:hypothetical protein
MLLSFQRPSHLFGRGFLPVGGVQRAKFRFWIGQTSIALAPTYMEEAG